MGRDLLTVPAAGLTGPTGVCLARADAALRDAGLQYGDVADEELREADLWLLHGHKKKSRRVQPKAAVSTSKKATSVQVVSYADPRALFCLLVRQLVGQ